MQVHALLSPELILIDLKGKTVESVIREISKFMGEKRCVKDWEKLYERLLARESLGSTSLPGGIAVPHCKMEEMKEAKLSLAISKEGVDFNSPDGKLTHLFFTAVSPPSPPNLHLQVLAAIARLARKGKEGLVDKLLESENPKEAMQVIENEEFKDES